MDPTVRNIEPPIKGELDTSAISKGCAFRSRCPFALDKCATETPELRAVASQQTACHRAEEFPQAIAPQSAATQKEMAL
jgi:peptide/nickel transport system ATP-binding protein/dipeptide transport system ATP-binding protein